MHSPTLFPLIFVLTCLIPSIGITHLLTGRSRHIPLRLFKTRSYLGLMFSNISPKLLVEYSEYRLTAKKEKIKPREYQKLIS